MKPMGEKNEEESLSTNCAFRMPGELKIKRKPTAIQKHTTLNSFKRVCTATTVMILVVWIYFALTITAEQQALTGPPANPTLGVWLSEV